MARRWVSIIVVFLIAVFAVSGDYRAFGIRDSRRDPMQYTPGFVGPRYLSNETVPVVPQMFVELVYQKYKVKHQSVRRNLTTVGRELAVLRKTGAVITGLKVHVALLTELKRLKLEYPTLIKQRAIAAPEFLRLMSDSIMVLEYLEILGAYGKALNEVTKNPVVDGVRLYGGRLLQEAARRFSKYYDADKRKSWAFGDRDITLFSTQGPRLIPLAASLFDDSLPDPIGYRIQFFDGYAQRILRKNSEQLDKLRMKKSSL